MENVGDRFRRPTVQHMETVETMSTKKKLCEMLTDLSAEELEAFKSLVEQEKGFPLFSSQQLKVTKTQDIVELMVKTYSQECLELTKHVLENMNRTDLVQRSIDTEEKHQPSLIQRVETTASVAALLLETLKCLSDAEFKRFKEELTSAFEPGIYSAVDSMQQMPADIAMLLAVADMQDTVCLMVQEYGQKSLNMTKEILKKLRRTDLVQRLSDSSSRPEKILSSEHQSALIHKVVTMVAVKELLSETLSDLSSEESKNLKWFVQFTSFQRSLPDTHLGLVQMADGTDLLVDMMVKKCGLKSVDIMREIFMDMNRTDLVQRLSETNSTPKVVINCVAAAAGSSAEVFGVNTTEKEKHSVEEDWPALIQKVESMESVIELLLETLKDLGVEELSKIILNTLKLPHIRRHPHISPRQMAATGIQDTVFIRVLTDGQQSVKTIKAWLEKMERTDLAQRLSDRSSGSKNEHRSALIHKVATIAAVYELLSGTLNDLNDEELPEFVKFLQSAVIQKDLPDISQILGSSADREVILCEMVRNYGRQSVELTREVFMVMKRTDLVQRLSKPSSGEKCFEHRPAPSERAEAKAAVKKILLETLKGLGHIKLNKFRWLLQFTNFQRSLPQINWLLTRHLHFSADRGELLVHLLVEACGQQSVEVTKEVLMDMNRTDLVKRLSEASSGLKERPSRRLEREGCGSTLDSSDWTKLEPEVNSTDADEAPTYSLQSEAGNFECSVSGLRWVCKEKVSFKYQFCSWEEPMERMESMKYMLAGPLIDITVNAGKLDEVFLPHWICIDDNPEIRDKFAVLHIDDCGDVVEKVAEVTSSHVKLSEPVFSPRAVLMKVGVPVRINCNVLIYKTDTAFLTLHVYLIPCDPGLQQELNRRQFSSGYRAIQKPHPEKSLKMGDRFILTADLDGAKIYPENLKLRYESRFPNFFEVYIKKPDTDFTLSLAQKNERQSVWTREIRKDEYQSTGHKQVEHFVDKHQCDLIERVSNTGPILDNLLREGVIQQEDYDTIGTIPTTQERMRKLFSGPLKAGGQAAKDVFFRILEEKESYLVADLKRKET
ncbi:uncharacterized protein AB9X84_023226 isoform 2-T2 [Acanthopagrus schlegelii]